jgi:hypothetical protein
MGKRFFVTFFRGKFQFSPTLVENFPRNFSRKKCTKNRPLEPNLCTIVSYVQRRRCEDLHHE